MQIIGIIFILLILFQLKHFLADYPLQISYMLGKFKGGRTDWILPLSAHCLVHAIMTFVIVQCFTGNLALAFSLAHLDFVIHFVMDRIKASPNYLGRFKALSGTEYMGLLNEINEMEKLCTLDSELDLNNARDIVKIQKRFRNNQYFWYSLGLDQAVHHLTHYVIIYLIIGGI